MVSNDRPKGSHRLLTLGRLFLLFEIYLFAATQTALRSDTFIAPPLLIFLVLHRWMLLGILVAIICGCEFLWRRTWLTASVLCISVIVAGVGDALLKTLN
jgi:hypothetical protein